MNGAIYSIRAMQSSKKITVAYTGKDAMTGTMKTEENTVEGPVMVFITTTAVEIDGETASRFLFISLDESEEMTGRILAKQREKHTIQGLMAKLDSEKIIKKHNAVNRLLQPLYVINPYSNLLTFTSKSLRARRDHMKYLNLILAITYMFQYQRETKKMKHNGKDIEYITVKIADIEKANTIASEVIGRCIDELSPPSKRLLLLIQEMVKKICKEKSISPKDCRFSRRDVRLYTGWSDFQVKTHIKELEELEYLYSLAGKKGKEYVYELIYTAVKGNPKLLGQIDIEELKQKAKSAGIPIE